jgi:transposase-like protein
MMELSYRCHRFPPVVIQHAVWVYLRFTISYRDVEDLLAERGLDISYETIRSWVLKFGPVICAAVNAAPTSPERSMASGRDGRLDRREADVPVASRRPRGRGP